MAFLYSPMKLWELFKNKSIANEPCMQNAKWFLTDAGKAAYDSANTTEKKALFFYIYLQKVVKEEVKITLNEKRLMFLQKLSYLMADAMDKANSPFYGFNKIMSKESNPLLDPDNLSIMLDDKHIDPGFSSCLIITALHNDEGSICNFDSLEKDEKSPMFRIEREAMRLFLDEDEKLVNVIHMPLPGSEERKAVYEMNI